MKTTPAPLAEARSVGIWVRVSTEDQAKGESPEHQVSGKSVKDHAEAKRMLTDIRRGHITGLSFSKLARLARNTRELLGEG